MRLNLTTMTDFYRPLLGAYLLKTHDAMRSVGRISPPPSLAREIDHCNLLIYNNLRVYGARKELSYTPFCLFPVRDIRTTNR